MKTLKALVMTGLLASPALAGEWLNVDFSKMTATTGNTGYMQTGGGYIGWNGDHPYGGTDVFDTGIRGLNSGRAAISPGSSGLLLNTSSTPSSGNDVLFMARFNSTAYPTAAPVGDPSAAGQNPGTPVETVNYGSGDVIFLQFTHFSDRAQDWAGYPMEEMHFGEYFNTGTQSHFAEHWRQGVGLPWNTPLGTVDATKDYSDGASLGQNYTQTQIIRSRADGSAGMNEEVIGQNGSIDINSDTAAPVAPTMWRDKVWVDAGEAMTLSSYATATGTAQLGYLNIRVGKTKSTDANLDYTTDIDDALILLGNFNKTSGMTMTQGDATNDGAVDIDDALALLGNFNKASDAAAVGTAHAHYDPATGHVYLDAKGVSGYSLKSASPGYLTGTTPLWSTTGTSRTDTDLKIGEASFSGNLNDLTSYDLGAVAATNIAAGNLTFTYSVTGLGTFSSAVQYMAVPEPAALSLLAIGALGLLARRRRAA